MLTAPQAASPQALQLQRRVIIHLDLDCFYAQVEQKRLGIPRDVPCAVQQWNGLIAVNYAARAAGITRHMRVAQAQKQCPELHLVHVQTIGHIQPGAATNTAGGATPAAVAATTTHTAAAAARTATADGGTTDAASHATASAAAGDVEGSAQDRGSSKACLQRYRRASADIMRLLAVLCPGCLLEKASIDEAYLDITSMALCELGRAEGAADEPQADGGDGVALLLARASGSSVVLGQGGLQQDIDYDRLAAAGAVVAQRMRGAVLSQLDFTVSAGIAQNKLLAKIGSAKNKPNQQTIVLPRAVEELMQGLPLSKVKGLGGKLGQQLEQLGATTAGEAARLPWESLVAHFGSKARWVFNAVRGIDDEPVIPKDKVKSINSCKSFPAMSDLSGISQWLGVLAAELAERMAEDEAEHSRRPRSLVLQYRGGAAPAGSRVIPDRSIRGAMPSFSPRDCINPHTIAAAALALFKRIKPPPWPLVRLALVATEFLDLSGAAAGSGAAMARFLAAGSSRQQQQQQQGAQSRVQPHAGISVSAGQGEKLEAQQHGSLEQFLVEPRPAGPHQQQQQLPLLHTARPRAQADVLVHEAVHDQQQQGHANANDSTAAAGETAPAVFPSQSAIDHFFSAPATARSDSAAAAPHPANAAAQQEQQQEQDLLQNVDVAEQARIFRDIEIQGMLQRQHHGSSGNAHAAGYGSRKRHQQDGQQQPKGSTKKLNTKQAGKQASISDLFGKCKGGDS